MWKKVALIRLVTSRLSKSGPARIALLAGCLLAVGCNDAPRFEGAATSNTGKNGASSLSIPVPASTIGGANGDLLIAVLGVKVNPGTSGPGGWTAVPGFGGFNGATCGSDQEGIACQLSVYYKISNGSESSASFSWGTTAHAAGAVLRYTQVHQGTPIGATGEQSGSSGSPTAPSVTTTVNETRVLRIALTEADDIKGSLGGSLILGGAPATVRFNIVSFSDASSDPSKGCGPPLSGCLFTTDAVGLAASDARRKNAGATGTASWSLPGSDQWVAASIAIRPESSGGAVVSMLRE